ncbi:hypothetical protein EG860_15980, partial [Enterococcus faecalis]
MTQDRLASVIVSLGFESESFGIPGVQEHA